MLTSQNGRLDSLTIRARVIDPMEGIDAPASVIVEDGVVTAIDRLASAPAGLVLAPAFVDPHVHLRTPGREDEETIASGHRGCGGGRLLRDRRDAQHRARGRHRVRSAGARRARARRGPRTDRLHGCDLEGPARGGADRDGRARRGRRDSRSPMTGGPSPPQGSCGAPSPTARSPTGRSLSTARSRRSRATARCTRGVSPPSSGSRAGRRSRRA